MNDEEINWKLVALMGGLRPQADVDKEPALTLACWQAWRVSSGAIHLMGYCLEHGQGRTTTALIAGNAYDRRCVTVSGRQYTLKGPSGRDPDAQWVWSQFLGLTGLTAEVDVSERLFDLLPRPH